MANFLTEAADTIATQYQNEADAVAATRGYTPKSDADIVNAIRHTYTSARLAADTGGAASSPFPGKAISEFFGNRREVGTYEAYKESGCKGSVMPARTSRISLS